MARPQLVHCGEALPREGRAFRKETDPAVELVKERARQIEALVHEAERLVEKACQLLDENGAQLNDIDKLH